MTTKTDSGAGPRDPAGAIERLLRVAGRRLALRRLVRTAESVLASAAVLVLLLALADRTPVAERAGFVAWTAVLPTLLAGVAVVTAVLARRGRPDRLDVAMLVDESLGLRGRIAAAVSLEDADGPFARAAIRDAERVAAEPDLARRLARRLPVRAGRHAGVASAAVLLALGTSLVPPLGLWGGAAAEEEARASEVREARREAESAVAAVSEQLDAAEELRAALGDEAADLSLPETPAGLEEPEEIRREALKRMTELKRKLDEIVDGEQGRRMEALDRMMEGLEDPGEGPARDLAGALRRGDFAAAKEALEELLRRAEEGGFDDEQTQRLQEQLERLAEQLEQAAENRERLEEALEKAGLDPRLASSPEALEQAIAQAPNLNEEQRRQLQQLADAQAQASGQCRTLADAMSAMAGAMGGTPGAFRDAGASALAQLTGMEQLELMLQQANAVMSRCQGSCMGLGQGLGPGGRRPGPGSSPNRGPGGGENPVRWAASGTQAERIRVESGEGEIIARMLVDGDPTVGSSRAVARDVVRRAARGFDEAMAQEKIPPRYREAMRRYFGRLQEQAERPVPAAGDESGG